MSFWKLRPVVGGALLLYAALSCNALSASAGELHRKTGATSSMTDSLRAMVDALLDPSSPLARKLLRADMSPTCSLGLLRLVRGIRDLEPWALRIVDSSGKYPTGFLHGTSVDLGAYDECVATVVRDEYDYIQTRGQYCVLQLQLMGNDSAVEYFVPAATMVHKRASNFISYWTDPLAPGARIGICIVDRCSEEDIEALARTVLPDTLKVTVSDCVTSEYPSISPTQAGIICFLSCIAAMMFFSTLLHVYLWFKNRSAKEGQVIRLLTSFSVLRNTQYIVSLDEKSSDENSFTFMNGMRFLSIAWIILGHVYGGMTDILAGRTNMLFFFDYWPGAILPAGFLSVDTFLFLSGFLLSNAVFKLKKPPVLIVAIAAVRRYIRVVVPVAFLLACMQLLPLAVQGPSTTRYYREIQTMIEKHWYHFLLQVFNFKHELHSIALVHIWYVSADFQLFLVSLAVLLIFRWSKFWCGAAFFVLSVLSCVVSMLQVHKTDLPPFMVGMPENFSTTRDILNNYYVQPFYHAVCFFSGCITWLLKDSFNSRPFPKAATIICWILSIGCGLTCVFIKVPWYQARDPTGEAGKLCMAFFDRILWAICLSWITLACSTKRGGIMDSFLSWKGFEPLSKLAFTVYLVHMPLYDLMNHYARERTYFSHFSLVTQFFSVLLWSYFLGYLLSISCEAPLGHIDRFLFSARRKPPQVIESKQVDEVLMEEKKHSFFVITSNGIFRRREEESKVIE
ncbi:nose resistant to fluoxetine protein 6-like [Amblyomma americanum]